MAGLRLYTSNRMETLAQKLAELLRTPLISPFEKEVIVVQSRGMERWVRMELARYHGICANVQFPFPNAIIQEIYSRVFKDLRDDPIYDPVIMTWKIMGLLLSCAKMPGFEAIRFYLEKRGNHLKWVQLSRRVADIFDQYLVYRPEMILDWEEGKQNHWQALLWRKLVEGRKKNHRAALKKTLVDMIHRRAVGAGSLPQRISIFGISNLPPYHMEIFGGISKLIEVNLFLMNPSKEYWADIVTDKERERFLKREGGDDELHLETGNSLLANMGALGRDFFVLVTGLECEEHECFEDVEARDILSCIQSDILLLRESGKVGEDKRVVSQDDTSIQIHSCHSPLREMEVLYDSLLSMFERNPDLEPRDIVVMMPDIEVYAPFIQAVFDIPGDDRKRIPFSIADRTVRSESLVVESFLAIVDFSSSRFGASEALSFLECISIRKRFHLSEEDLPIIQRWVIETGIRWGIDARHREELGLQPQSENTWRFGLERLLLGYAMPGQEEKMFSGILPYDYVEGDEAVLLGKFAEFAEALFSHVPGLGEARTLSEWSKSLTVILDRFFLPEDETAREIHVIRDTLHSLTIHEELSGFHEEVELEVIKEFLVRELEKQGFGFGFITGGITFCAMLPMRSIPFKVVCLAGMNNDAYPRQSKKLGFDLMAKHPRQGDRSRRKDDRYLFLEALLSARKTLYISYLGQSVQDNSYIPPSVMVSELLDYIEKAFTIPDKPITYHVLTTHRLQAFSPSYFRGGKKYLSYSEENFQAARRAAEERIPPKRFISKRLSEPSEEWKTLYLGQLSRFFGNPTRYLLRERLGIRLEMRSKRLNDIEPFEVEGLDKYHLEQMLVEKGASGWDLKGFGEIAKGSGQLPHGTLGECFYERIREGAEVFVDMVKARTGERPLPAFESKIWLAGCVLKGRLARVYPEGLIHYRYAKLKAKDHLGIWLPHLFLNCSAPTQYPRNSILLGKGETWMYAPLDGSKEILDGLLERYLKGLSEPLLFFPEASLKYAEGLIEKGKSEEVALVDARKRWKGSDFSRGETEDEYYKICFGETDPLDAEFRNLAVEILAPLIRSRKRLLK